jgi:sulfate permease, SulP family
MSDASIFTPKLVSTLREGYGAMQLRADAVAGLTVAIVALPLSMAIAIASHATPAAGLTTAIVGGFLISALGGSRYQIGGPAGAFIVLVASIIDTHGFDGLLLATLMAGCLMILGGFLRLGNLIRLVPHPVIVGFSAGIATIIFASQLKELAGLSLAGPEPADIISKLRSLWEVVATLNPQALTISAVSIGIIVVQRIFRPSWPGFLLAVVASTLLCSVLRLDVETIGTRFGGIPHGLTWPSVPQITFDKMVALLPAAISLALLGSIESLLSAVVADSMKARRHRSNIELVAQGIANVACAMFGGITATGTIARTATNVRAGAHGPVSGMLHAIILLLFMLIAAPLAGFIPLAALAGILAVVAWNMFDKSEVARLLTSWPTASVLLATLLLTVFRDLLEGIAAGTALFYLLQMIRRESNLDRS